MEIHLKQTDFKDKQFENNLVYIDVCFVHLRFC